MSEEKMKMDLATMLVSLREYYHKESESYGDALDALQSITTKEEKASRGPGLRHQMRVAEGHKRMIARAIGAIEPLALSRDEI